MKRSNNSIDGFIPARRPTRLGLHNEPKTIQNAQQAADHPTLRAHHQPQTEIRESEIDIEETLKQISDPQQDRDRSQKRRRKRDKIKPTKSPAKKWIKRLVILVIIGLLVVAGLFVKEWMQDLNRVFQGNIFGLFEKHKLKQDENGLTNVLIFGTSPEGWDGADLADSIMVLSYHQDKNIASTVSLPRDLYVRHTCRSFLGTIAGRLNESYVCGKKDAESAGKDEKEAELAGQQELAKAAQEVLGLEIHYQVHANWKVLMDLVDSIGGIDITIEAYDGSAVVYDAATNIRYKNGETVHLNGERALAFSRARGSAGGTGLSGGNFDRERNQQKILKAIVDKIKTSNMANIGTVTNILDSLGNNIQTTFETKELQTLVEIVQKLNPDNITSVPLVDEEEEVRLLTTGNISGVSVVVPAAGTYDYSDIRAYVAKTINPSDITKEDAKIVVLNASGVAGVAGAEKKKLSELGMNITEIGNFPGEDKTKHIIYDNSNGAKSHTVDKLKEIYGDNVKTSLPESLKNYTADVILVLGSENQ